MLNWQVILLAAVCSILFATQPRVSIKESKQKKVTDRNTMLLILIVSSAGQIISLLEWAYISKSDFGIHVQPFLVPPGMESQPYVAPAESQILYLK